MKKQLSLSQKNTYDVKFVGINKLLDFMMHSVMLAIGHITCENYYSFQFSIVGSYVMVIVTDTVLVS